MIDSSTSRNHISDVSAYILATGSPSFGSPNRYIHKHASFQEKAAKLHCHIPQEKETNKYFQTAARLSISSLELLPLCTCYKTRTKKCRDKKRKEDVKREEQKHLALGMDNTLCARAHTIVEEVQREVSAQNETLASSTPERWTQYQKMPWGKAELEWTCTKINSVF